MAKITIKLKEILQGVAVGIANIIPGFSGGTMAVIFKIYERIIGAFSEIFRHPIKVIKDVWAIFLGMAIGILASVFAISKLIESYPVITVMFFVGLIIGSIPFIYLEIKDNKKINIFDVIGFLIAISLMIILPLLNTNAKTNIQFDFKLVVICFFLGVISAATMIIPGVSGSLVLMILGFYFFIIDTLKDAIQIFLSFNFTTEFTHVLLIVISFTFGIVVGVAYISKFMRWLFTKNSKLTYCIILGLLVSSPFSIVVALIKEYEDAFSNIGFWGYVLSFATLTLGILISGFFSLYEKKNNPGQKNE